MASILDTTTLSTGLLAAIIPTPNNSLCEALSSYRSGLAIPVYQTAQYEDTHFLAGDSVAGKVTNS